ncbi:MAG: RloB domain-containing protein [Gammaproteobacteria bacterium]|nr:RloB domain-containing protein [Gammaproteobacteria bacterium]MYJ51657.1 RloB domain-containing protein [Gammaproteobacteria bacterium]
MGTDNLYHKRKAKSVWKHARRKARRAAYSKVLIVCEGQNTEFQYFRGLRDYYGLNSANVDVCKDCNSDPLEIYKYAKRRYRQEKNKGDPFDHVFCVFDKDSHGTYSQALDQIRRTNPLGTFVAINSVPCFEYWLLLHFSYTERPYTALSGNSACNQVLTELKNHIPDYSKGYKNTFGALAGNLDTAIDNARSAMRAAESVETDNPTTRVYELVDFLRNLKKNSSR